MGAHRWRGGSRPQHCGGKCSPLSSDGGAQQCRHSGPHPHVPCPPKCEDSAHHKAASSDRPLDSEAGKAAALLEEHVLMEISKGNASHQHSVTGWESSERCRVPSRGSPSGRGRTPAPRSPSLVGHQRGPRAEAQGLVSGGKDIHNVNGVTSAPARGVESHRCADAVRTRPRSVDVAPNGAPAPGPGALRCFRLFWAVCLWSLLPASPPRGRGDRASSLRRAGHSSAPRPRPGTRPSGSGGPFVSFGRTALLPMWASDRPPAGPGTRIHRGAGRGFAACGRDPAAPGAAAAPAPWCPDCPSLLSG